MPRKIQRKTSVSGVPESIFLPLRGHWEMGFPEKSVVWPPPENMLYSSRNTVYYASTTFTFFLFLHSFFIFLFSLIIPEETKMVFAFFAPPHARPEESQSHSGDPCVFNTILPTFSPGESAHGSWADPPSAPGMENPILYGTIIRDPGRRGPYNSPLKDYYTGPWARDPPGTPGDPPDPAGDPR